MSVLLFSKTAGFRHESIPDGIKAIEKLGKDNNFTVHNSEDSNFFNTKELNKYDVVIFLSTTGSIFTDAQRKAFQKWYREGGGFVGIHSATDTEYDWPWYNELAGAYFSDHPPGVHSAIIDRVILDHASTKMLPNRWTRTDEWYNFKSMVDGTNKLLNLDESSYVGGNMGTDHPVAWHRAFDGGRSWYTALGHTKESYTEPLFLDHLLGGILYAGTSN